MSDDDQRRVVVDRLGTLPPHVLAAAVWAGVAVTGRLAVRGLSDEEVAEISSCFGKEPMDRVRMADHVYAEVSSDGKRALPHNPCPVCGRESAEHRPDPETLAPRMICMTQACRHVYPGLPKR